MDSTQIASLWNSVVVHGTAGVTTISGTITNFSFYMSADRTECAHNIRSNDPLRFSATYNASTNVFKVTSASIYTNPPAGSHLALGRKNLRCQTIKDATPEKLLKYFNKVLNELIIPNITNLSSYQTKLTTIYTNLNLGGV